jgi:signal transduction histidine kinase
MNLLSMFDMKLLLKSIVRKLCLRLSNNILDVAKIERGGLKLNKEVFDINEAISSLC